MSPKFSIMIASTPPSWRASASERGVADDLVHVAAIRGRAGQRMKVDHADDGLGGVNGGSRHERECRLLGGLAEPILNRPPLAPLTEARMKTLIGLFLISMLGRRLFDARTDHDVPRHDAAAEGG
jgi:hypothetical protein